MLAAALAGGCATPATNIRLEAANLGFSQRMLHGGGYALESFFHPGIPGAAMLHVYLEGDGQPWETRYRPAVDPTTRDPLMLRLMAIDPAPALYLGRPCYQGHAADSGCAPAAWTRNRYGVRVINAMTQGLRSFLNSHPVPMLRFFGHSGGGTLALLLAERFPETDRVVTVAANVDTAAWAGLHRYAPLTGSLNPADRKDSNSGFEESHYYGADDGNTPPDLFAAAIRRRGGQQIVISGYNHHCCWESLWPTILRSLPNTRAEAASPPPGSVFGRR